MGKFGHLRAHRIHHAWRRVADRRHCDARTQVDEPVTVHVFHDAAAGAGYEHRQGDPNTAGHRRRPAVSQCLRCGTGDFGDQAPTLLQAGHRSSSPGSPVHIAGKAYLLTDVSGLPDWTGTLDCYQVRGPRVGLAP